MRSFAVALVIFGNPAALAFGVKRGDELGADVRDERLKSLIPAVFLMVKRRKSAYFFI
jgi:hypothetical protein